MSAVFPPSATSAIEAVSPPVVWLTSMAAMFPRPLMVIVYGPPGLPVTVILPVRPVIVFRLAWTWAAVGKEPGVGVSTFGVVPKVAAAVSDLLVPDKAPENVMLNGPPGLPVT